MTDRANARDELRCVVQAINCMYAERDDEGGFTVEQLVRYRKLVEREKHLRTVLGLSVPDHDSPP